MHDILKENVLIQLTQRGLTLDTLCYDLKPEQVDVLDLLVEDSSFTVRVNELSAWNKPLIDVLKLL